MNTNKNEVNKDVYDKSRELWNWREEFGELGEDPVSTLITKLSDADQKVRWKVAWVLGQLEDVRAVEPLIASFDFRRPFVAGEDEFTLNLVTAWALGRLKDSRAVAPLEQALSNKCSDFVWIAAWALGEIGDIRAVEPLRAALEKDEFECVWSADAPVALAFDDHLEISILDYIISETYSEPVSPIVRALEKLGIDTEKQTE